MSSIKFTKFVEQKLLVWFQMKDTNKNGFLELEDYKLAADRYAKEYKLSDAERDEIQRWLEGGLKSMIKRGKETNTILPLMDAIQADLDEGKKVPLDRFVKAYGEFITKNPAAVESMFNDIASTFFDIMDTDKDGKISPEEMVVSYKCFGMEEDVARKIATMFYQHETINGVIDKKSHIDMWVDFVLGENRKNPLLKVFAPNVKLD